METQYRYILSILGIGVSSKKSFSEVGIAEFAKAYYRNGVDLKPLSPDLFLWGNPERLARIVALSAELNRKD